MKKYNIPIFIPHEGCPHDCVFCNQRKITGIDSSVTPQMAEEIIAEHLGYLQAENRTVEIAFFGGSFTGLPLKLQEKFYKSAWKFRDKIDGIRMSTRPDYIDDDILALAKKWGVTTIELGVQSADDKVLEMNNRGHTFEQTCMAIRKIREAEICVGVQMMTGMYGSNPDKDMKTAKVLAEFKPDCVRIYPVLVLKDTYLEQLYNNGEYVPQTIEEATEGAKDALKVFRDKNIPVIRIGLHSGEDLREEGNVVAGPFHPAMGELAESRLWRDRIEKDVLMLKKIPAVYEIPADKSEISKIIGHKRCNAEYFKNKYNIELKVLGGK